MSKHFCGLLNPFSTAEAMSPGEAEERGGWAVVTLRERAVKYGLGRKIGGRWIFSRVALELFLNGQDEALAAYHRGDRSDPIVVETFERLGVPHMPPLPPTRQRVR